MSKKDQEVHQKKKKMTARQEKIQKILEELQRTKDISNCQIGKEANSHPESQKHERLNHYVKRRNCTCVRTVLRKNCMKTTKAKIKKKGKKAESRTEKQKEMPTQFEPIPDFTTSEIQDAIDRLNSGVRAEQLNKLQ